MIGHNKDCRMHAVVDEIVVAVINAMSGGCLQHMAHDAAFKARTKSRAKMRDKKSVGAGLD